MFIGQTSSDKLMAKILDRQVSFSYNSMRFLQYHGFRLERAFADGICYLSRQENIELGEMFMKKPAYDESTETSITDEETRDFAASVREMLTSWLADTQSVRLGSKAN
jgi:hypothetical protein